MSAQNKENEIFVSYSRLDSNYVNKVIFSLKERGVDPWFDKDDIPKGREWWREIQKGINGANSFVFIISAGSLRSMVCNWELAHAINLSKKIIPLLYEDVFSNRELMSEIGGLEWDDPDGSRIVANDNWNHLKDLNFIRYCDDEDLMSSVEEALVVARTDYDYIENHTRLLARATEWLQKGSRNPFLLTGDEIEEAETWLEKNKTKHPLPSDLHREYILTSRKNAKRQRQRLVGGISIAVIIVTIVGLVALWQSQLNSQEQARNESLRLAALGENQLATNLEESVLLGIHAIDAADTQEAYNLLITGLDQLYEQQTYEGFLYPRLFLSDYAYVFAGIINKGINTSSNTMMLWETETGKLLQRFDLDISSNAISPDVNQLILGIRPPTTRNVPSIQLVNIKTGDIQLRFEEKHTDVIRNVAFSPDGTQAISNADDDQSILWDVQTGEVIRSLDHTDPITDITFTPIANRVISMSSKGGWETNRLVLWNTDTGKIIQQFDVSTSYVRNITFSSDGQLALARIDKNLILWNVNTGETLDIFEDVTENFGVFAFLPNSKQFVASLQDGHINLWDIETGQLLISYIGHSSSIDKIIFSSDGRQFISIALDEALRLWDVSTGETLTLVNGNFQDAVFTQHGWRSLSEDRLVTQPPHMMIGHAQLVNSIAFSPDGNQAISGSDDGTVRVWNVSTGQLIQLFEAHNGRVSAVAFLPDGTKILSASANKVYLWDLESGDLIREYGGQTENIQTIALMPDGTQILTGTTRPNYIFSVDSTLQLWDTQTGERIDDFTSYFTEGSETIYRVDFTPNGERAIITSSYDVGVAGGRDAIIRIWNTSTNEVESLFTIPDMTVKATAFSPTSNHMILATNNQLSLMNIQTNEVIKIFEGHTANINSVAFSPDGSYIVSGAEDNTVRLWDSESGQVVRLFEGHTAPITALAFSPDGKQIISSSKDKTIRLWYVDTKDLLTYACSRVFNDLSENKRIVYQITDTTPICRQFEISAVDVMHQEE